MVLADRTPNQELLEQAILYVSKEYNADIFLLVGRMSDELGHGFIDLCPSAPKVQNCILMMTTSGGDLEAAYRIIPIRRDCAVNLMAHHPSFVIPAKAGIQ